LQILVGYGYELEESPQWYKLAWKNSIFGQSGVDYQDWVDCHGRHVME